MIIPHCFMRLGTLLDGHSWGSDLGSLGNASDGTALHRVASRRISSHDMIWLGWYIWDRDRTVCTWMQITWRWRFFDWSLLLRDMINGWTHGVFWGDGYENGNWVDRLNGWEIIYEYEGRKDWSIDYLEDIHIWAGVDGKYYFLSLIIYTAWFFDIDWGRGWDWNLRLIFAGWWMVDGRWLNLEWIFIYQVWILDQGVKLVMGW